MTQQSEKTSQPSDAMSPFRSPFYVVVFGLTFGTSIAMAKLGALEGLPPMALVFWQMLGAGLLLGAAAWIKGQRPRLYPRHVRYYVVAGILGNAFPTTLAFMAASKIGTGLTGLVYPLSPVFTYALAVLIGMDKAHSKKIFGLALGLVGAVFIIVSPLLSSEEDIYSNTPILWLAIACTVPVFLACGNVYRSYDWPPNTGSLPLASGMLLATALMLLPVLFLTGNFRFPDMTGSSVDLIILGSTFLSFIGFIVYFELQRTAGPVYFSQVSYFIAIATMTIGVFLFDEVLDWSVWIAVGMIFGGLYLVNKSR